MFDTVIDSVIAALTAENIPAVRKFPADILDRDSAAVAVGLKSGCVSASGYGDYLGILEQGGELTELYGSKAELCLSIEIFTPAADGHAEEECTELLGDICACIGGLAGVKLRSFEGNAPAYDEETEMFRCESVLTVMAYLVRESDDAGGFTDFVLKGVIA